MWLIVSLLIVGIVLLFVELLLIPGTSIAGIGAFLAMTAGILYGYMEYGMLAGALVLTIAIILSVITVIISLRANTWKRLSLNTTLEGVSTPTPAQLNIVIGQRGTTLTRLAPMGKVSLGDLVVDAKSMGSYIDPRQPIEVIGFDNTVTVVSPVNLHFNGENG